MEAKGSYKKTKALMVMPLKVELESRPSRRGDSYYAAEYHPISDIVWN
jgi:hypothetical protein